MPDVFVFENLVPHRGTNPTTGHIELRPDPACVKAIQEIECGHGVSMVTKREVFVGEGPATFFNKKPWSQLKRESIYVPAQESFAPIENYIINTCKQNNCNDQVTKFKVKLDELKSIGAVLSPSP